MVDTNQIIGIIVSGNLSRFVVAGVILLLGFLAARLVKNILVKILKETNTNKVWNKGFGLKIPMEQLIPRIFYYSVIIASFIIAFNQIGLNKAMLYLIIALAFIVLMSLIALIFKELMINIFASIFTSQKKIIKKGDDIEINKIVGNVIEISLMEIKLKTIDNEMVHVPMSLLLKEKIKKLNK